MTVTLAAILGAFERYQLRFGSEAELQDAIADVLEREWIAFAREVSLNPRQRLDFLCGSVAIEVKTRGSLSDLTRQVHGYLEDDRVEALVVVTSRSRLCQLPGSMRGKVVLPVLVRCSP